LTTAVIQRGHIYRIAVKRHATVHYVAADRAQGDLGKVVVVLPQLLAGAGLESNQVILRRGDEEIVAIDDGRRFVAHVQAGFIVPDLLELADVCGIDRIEWRIARTGVIAAIHQPAVVAGRGIEPGIGNRRIRLLRKYRLHREAGEKGSHQQRADEG
jgi:hypothetical protein